MRPILLAFALSIVACDEAPDDADTDTQPDTYGHDTGRFDDATGLPVWEVQCALMDSIVIVSPICGNQRFECNTGRMDLWFTQESPGVCVAVTLTGSCATGPGPGRSELVCSNDVGTWSAWVLDAP